MKKPRIFSIVAKILSFILFLVSLFMFFFFLQKDEDAAYKKLYFIIAFGVIYLVSCKVESYEKKLPPIKQDDVS